jgi:predicted DNA-binding transcriptional regulator AlpA
MQRDDLDDPSDVDLSTIRVLTRRETIKILGLSDRTWDRLEYSGQTPPKTQLSDNRIGYRLADIAKWLDGRREPAVIVEDRRRGRARKVDAVGLSTETAVAT